MLHNIFFLILLKDIKKKVEKFSKDLSHHQAQACVVCIMSHGGEGGKIYGTDGEHVVLSELKAFFNNVNCKALHNKPKLFFVQACRGSMHEHSLILQN